MYKLAACTLAMAVSIFAQIAPPRPADQAGLWASLSISPPVFQPDRTEVPMFTFAVVNDGPSAIDPETENSRLFINDEEFNGWPWIAANGPRDAQRVLQPGGIVMFTKAMGDLFQKPGIYTFRWEGQHFRSQEVILRVLPKH
jgi:hypothetical protein